MSRVLPLCVACWAWGCGAVADLGVVLMHHADDGAARLEDRILTPYRARHPGLQVTQRHAATSQAEYRRRLGAALVGDAPPDVFLLDDVDAPAVAGGPEGAGGALDLAPYLSRVGVDLKRFDPAVLAIFRRGTRVYALPRGYTPLVVAYNRDLLDRAGIAYPTDDWTWDDFLRLAQRLTRDSDGDGWIDQWGAAFDGRPSFWLPWIWAGGGDVLCSDGRRASGCLDSPATIAAMRWYAAWVTHPSVAPRIHDPGDGRGAGESARLFVDGRVAFMTVDRAAVRGLRALVAAHRLRVGLVAIPHRAGVAPATVLYASGYAVPALALRRKIAVELAADLTDSLADAARGEAGIELPAVLAAAQALAAADTLGWEGVLLRAAAHGRPAWGARVAQWTAVEAELAELMERITVGGADPGQAARAAARELDRMLGTTR